MRCDIVSNFIWNDDNESRNDYSTSAELLELSECETYWVASVTTSVAIGDQEFNDSVFTAFPANTEREGHSSSVKASRSVPYSQLYAVSDKRPREACNKNRMSQLAWSRMVGQSGGQSSIERWQDRCSVAENVGIWVYTGEGKVRWA